MEYTDGAAHVTYSDLQTHLLSYNSHVPPDIRRLELLRLKDTPETLAQRKKHSEAFLEKEEVTSLVQWKLKHGTYRPNLAKLVASNNVKDIRETTKSAFAIYEADNNDYSKAITALTKLKGIGPATASLLLSTYDPIKVPFFSDELYRYLHFEASKSKGWDRKINYTMKEYKELFSKLQTLRSRLEKEGKQQVSAIDIEKMAYVLGKEATSSTESPPNKRDAEDQEALPPPPAKRHKKGDGVAPPSSKPASWIAQDLRREEQVRRKGLNGSPTYDTLGYELDKEYIIKKTSNRMPSARSAWGKKAMDHFAEERRKTERKVKILGLAKSPNNISPFDEFAWNDKVARDLGIAYHLVGMEEYEEWKRKGSVSRKGSWNGRISRKKRGRGLRGWRRGVR